MSRLLKIHFKGPLGTVDLPINEEYLPERDVLDWLDSGLGPRNEDTSGSQPDPHPPHTLPSRR